MRRCRDLRGALGEVKKAKGFFLTIKTTRLEKAFVPSSRRNPYSLIHRQDDALSYETVERDAEVRVDIDPGRVREVLRAELVAAESELRALGVELPHAG